MPQPQGLFHKPRTSQHSSRLQTNTGYLFCYPKAIKWFRPNFSNCYLSYFYSTFGTISQHEIHSTFELVCSFQQPIWIKKAKANLTRPHMAILQISCKKLLSHTGDQHLTTTLVSHNKSLKSKPSILPRKIQNVQISNNPLYKKNPTISDDKGYVTLWPCHFYHKK